MAFLPEPSHAPVHAARTAVVLCNLGTPDAPNASAVRRYLREFLSDPRVVEIPPLLWKVILNALILPLRPFKSAAKYRKIWTQEGSPLLHWARRQAQSLEDVLHRHGHDVVVHPAMRYGNPALPEVLSGLRQRGIQRILLVPMYPQYSGTTTASVIDAACAWSQKVRHVPEWRMVNRFHDHPLYIEALAQSVQQHWQTHGRGERLVLSFHGIPKRCVDLGDPYAAECRTTTRLLAQKLGLSKEHVVMTFQSRFGRAEWLQPYTEPTVEQLAKDGIRKVDVLCPGFVTDCLETLEEINMEVRATFLRAGGQQYHYIPCLNDRPEWITALAAICEQHLQGWTGVQD